MFAAFLAAQAASLAESRCKWSTSTPTTIEEIARHPASWFDRCVRLRGYVEGYNYYSGPAGYYRHGATDHDDRANEGFAGLYFLNLAGWRQEIRRADLIGRVDDCERSYDAEVARSSPDEVVMQIGYCHYQGGIILMGVDIHRYDAVTFKRETGAAARASFGDLELIVDAHSISPIALGLVSQFRDAFDKGDKAKLASLVEPYDFNVENSRQGRTYSRLLNGQVGPLRQWRRERLPDPTWFVEKLTKEQVRAEVEPDRFACFSRDDLAADTLPISRDDAKFKEGSPFACLVVFDSAVKDRDLTLGVLASDFVGE